MPVSVSAARNVRSLVSATNLMDAALLSLNVGDAVTFKVASGSADLEVNHNLMRQSLCPLDKSYDTAAIVTVSAPPVALTQNTMPNPVPQPGPFFNDCQECVLNGSKSQQTINQVVVEPIPLIMPNGSTSMTYLPNASFQLNCWGGSQSGVTLPETLKEFLEASFTDEVLRRDQKNLIDNFDLLLSAFVSDLSKHIHNICAKDYYINDVNFYAYLRDGKVDPSKLVVAGRQTKLDELKAFAREHITSPKKTVDTQVKSTPVDHGPIKRYSIRHDNFSPTNYSAPASNLTNPFVGLQ